MTDQDMKLCQRFAETVPTPVALFSFGPDGIHLISANDAFKSLLPNEKSLENVLQNWKNLTAHLLSLDKETEWKEYHPAFSDYLSLRLARVEDNLAEFFVTPSLTPEERLIEDNLLFGVIRYYRPADGSRAIPIYVNPAAKKYWHPV